MARNSEGHVSRAVAMIKIGTLLLKVVANPIQLWDWSRLLSNIADRYSVFFQPKTGRNLRATLASRRRDAIQMG